VTVGVVVVVVAAVVLLLLTVTADFSGRKRRLRLRLAISRTPFVLVDNPKTRSAAVSSVTEVAFTDR
jgi:hypothetical protein